MRRYRNVLSRRTMLRGAGTVAIALPFLDEMRATSVWAAEPEPPARALTVFFGEGCPINVQNEHLDALTGPFEPLQQHAAKLGFARGLRFPHEHHYGGGCGCFTGAEQVGDEGAQTTGPSIDHVMLNELYPMGLPQGVLGTTSMALVGTYHPDVGAPAVRYVKSWNDDGNPVTIPRFSAADLFDTVFGSVPTGEETPAELKLRRKRESVLDSVMDQFEHLTGNASKLGKQSRTRVKDHLDRVREYEQRAFGDITASCSVPDAPGNLPLMGTQDFHAGIIYDVNEFSAMWRTMADIYTLACKCDLIRFGNCHFLNVGDRINFQGDYTYDGQLIYTFDDLADLGGSGDVGLLVNHEHFHAWSNSGSPMQADHHLHFYMRELAYLLEQLDDAEYADENGQTLLDNVSLLITTELSDPGPHLSRDVFHAYTAGNGRFNVGNVVTASGSPERPASDFYNTILEAYGIDRRLGTAAYQQLTGVLA